MALRDVRDGHDFVPQAFRKGAAAALVEAGYRRVARRRRAYCGSTIRSKACAAIARAAPRSFAGGHRRCHRQRRQDRHQGGAARVPVAAGRDARRREVVQQPLGRAADAGAHAGAARYGVFEIGMNHAGEITPLSRLVRPHVAIITTVEPVHLAVLRLGRRRSPTPRPRSSPGSSRAARQSSIATIRILRSAAAACARSESARRLLRPPRRCRRSSRGAHAWCRRLRDCRALRRASASPTVSPRRGATSRRTRLRSWRPSFALGADVEAAVPALAGHHGREGPRRAPRARRRWRRHTADRREL